MSSGVNAALVIRVAAVVGFTGVLLGAMGAHILEDVLHTSRRVEIWETAVFYHLIHAVVLLVVGLTPRVSKLAAISLSAGIVLFSGSLYVLALTDIKWLGAITPLGGVGFLIGWAALAGRLGMARKAVEEAAQAEQRETIPGGSGDGDENENEKGTE